MASPSSSTRSSPFSSSSGSSTSDCLSPTNTAITSPSTSCVGSPKFGKLETGDTLLPQAVQHQHHDSLPFPNERFLQQAAPLSPQPDLPAYPFFPQQYSQQYSPPQTHLLSPQTLETSVATTPGSASSPISPVYSNSNSASQQTPATTTRYSGYPPASAFYGPSNSPSAAYDERPVDPRNYKIEDWYTADGRKVECSAMHLHCATM